MPAKPKAERVEVLNVNVPSSRRTVEKPRYDAMRRALLEALPRKAPGLTQAEMLDAVLPRLDEDLFPGGDKAMWWLKTVQLDLEARGVLARDAAARPLRWTRAR